MSCLYPKLLTVIPHAGVDKNGNPCSKVIFGKDGTYEGAKWFRETGAEVNFYTVPCGQCVECRLNRCRQWVDRLKMESMSYSPDEVSFLTLTYNNENLPRDMSVHKEHLQGFMKRLRIYLKRHFNKEVRFFACGEYGERGEELTGFGRPHYHLILFGFDFWHNDTLRKIGENKYGDAHYTSLDILENNWHYGFNTVCRVSDKVMFYVASYTMKKFTGKLKIDVYDSKGREPVFVLMSRRPGIGAKYLEENIENVKKTKSLVIPGGRSVCPSGYCLDIVSKGDLALRALLTDINSRSADNRNDYLVHQGINIRCYNQMVSDERQERKKLKEYLKIY